jgi:hypothetical protein
VLFFNDLYTNDEFCEDKSSENHACPVDMVFPPEPVSTWIQKSGDYLGISVKRRDRKSPLASPASPDPSA